MRKQRTEPTLVQKALETVPGCQLVFAKMQQQVTLSGQSQSTLNNYIRGIAIICLHFGRLPEAISDDELKEYFTAVALDPRSPSRSSFKHMVYGLRYYYRLIGDNKRAIGLPSLKREAALPVILNRSELRQLFKTPALSCPRTPLCGPVQWQRTQWPIFGQRPQLGDARDVEKTSINKQVNLHSLSHSYATHLLEDGLNIVTVNELLAMPKSLRR
jgi:site-specific recombinase XerD